jgi:hypothetical protein
MRSLRQTPTLTQPCLQPITAGSQVLTGLIMGYGVYSGEAVKMHAANDAMPVMARAVFHLVMGTVLTASPQPPAPWILPPALDFCHSTRHGARCFPQPPAPWILPPTLDFCHSTRHGARYFPRLPATVQSFGQPVYHRGTTLPWLLLIMNPVARR